MRNMKSLRHGAVWSLPYMSPRNSSQVGNRMSGEAVFIAGPLGYKMRPTQVLRPLHSVPSSRRSQRSTRRYFSDSPREVNGRYHYEATANSVIQGCRIYQLIFLLVARTDSSTVSGQNSYSNTWSSCGPRMRLLSRIIYRLYADSVSITWV